MNKDHTEQSKLRKCKKGTGVLEKSPQQGAISYLNLSEEIRVRHLNFVKNITKNKSATSAPTIATSEHDNDSFADSCEDLEIPTVYCLLRNLTIMEDNPQCADEEQDLEKEEENE
eukprot:g37805.t1